MSSFFKKRFLFVMIPLLCLGFTAFVLTAFFRIVDLKPKVDETFFFSITDPQLRADVRISKMFPESSQIILVVRGNIHSPEYFEGIRKFTAELAALPGVFSVQSLAKGPENVEDALKSPLWKRVLISEDAESSFIFASVGKVPAENLVGKIEEMCGRFEKPGFEVMISGVPYITELISRNLTRDLRVFSLAALVVFGVVLFIIFRSFVILIGTFVACVNASCITLILSHFLGVPIGPLTANLSTMVFVFTLSPIVFLTFAWKGIAGEKKEGGWGTVLEAMKITVLPSLWSMTTELTGFASLLFVPATPIRQLGIAGAIGGVVPFFLAYGVYPWFLQWAKAPKEGSPIAGRINSGLTAFFAKRHGAIVAGLVIFSIAASFGLLNLNMDPDLLSYFKKGGEIRNGLEYVDNNGGSSPLKIVVESRDKKLLKSGDAYKQLWTLHEALEDDPAVGGVVSIPLILAEAKRNPMSFLVSTEWMLDLLESPDHGEITKHFITEDRKKTLFMVRMKELDREEPRLEIIQRIKGTVTNAGFETVEVGGAYSLQGQLAELLTISLIEGVFLLIGAFAVMGWIISRSWQVTGAVVASLSIIPAAILGVLGWMRLPMDIITTPAVNLAIGMGVDAMIYLSVFARRARGKEGNSWAVWSKVCSQLWQPIGTSLVVVCSGFGIFLLSNFPPSQRFGFSVIFGSVAYAFAALFLFPWLASFSFGKKKAKPAKEAGLEAVRQ